MLTHEVLYQRKVKHSFSRECLGEGAEKGQGVLQHKWLQGVYKALVSFSYGNFPPEASSETGKSRVEQLWTQVLTFSSPENHQILWDRALLPTD